MIDEPNNASEQPQGLREDASGEGAVEPTGLPLTAATEAGAPVPPPGHAAAEAAAEQTATETATQSEPAETASAVQQPAGAGPESTDAEVQAPAETEPTGVEAAAEAAAGPEPVAPEVGASQPAETEPTGAATPAEVPEEPKAENMDWYILKVQSNREDSIREGLMRRVAIAGLERFFGEVIVPTEKVTEFKGGKKRVSKRKLYPGYLVVQMEINDDTWFLVRETPGIGDFTGAAGHPTPMLPHEVSRILAKKEEKGEKAPKLKIGFSPGDQVKINEGTFENFEGEVEAIDETNGRVTVMINIFGRSTPVELEYWQIEAV